MKGLFAAVLAIGFFGALVYLAFRPSGKPASLTSQIATHQQVSGTRTDNSESAVQAVGYTLRTFDGKEITFSQVNSQKPVVIQVWATWCEVCEREFPENNKIAQKYKDQIEYHAVNIGGTDQSPQAIEKYVKRKNLDPDAIKFLVDIKGDVSGQYGFRSTPQHLFIEKGGAIKFYKLGYMSPAEMENQIQALLTN